MRGIQRSGSAEARNIPYPKGHPARLRQLNALTSSGLLEETSKRPMRVRIPRHAFPMTLHGFLREQPSNVDLVTGNRLPLIAALAATGPARIEDLAHDIGVHPNTVRHDLQVFMSRALISKSGRGQYALADHAGRLKDLGRLYLQHCLDRQMRNVEGRIRIVSPLVRMVESDDVIEDLPTTAVTRFQEAGADVISARRQHRIHAFREEDSIGLLDALKDAEAIGTSARTLSAMREFLDHA